MRSLTLLLTCCLVLAPAAPAPAQFGGPAKVTVAQVEMRPLPASITLVGTLEPVTRSTIGAEIAGLVREMPVRQGDFVRAGELICKLKDDLLTPQLVEARERLKAYEATARRWTFERDRIRKLYGAQDAAEKEVYETEAGYDQAVHAVAEQKAVIARLETRLAKTSIHAPFSGFVVARHTEVGQWVNEGGPVVEMADLATVLARVNVPEGALPYVKVGAPAAVKVAELNRRFDGTVRHVIPQADPTARTFPVEIAVPNPGYDASGNATIPRVVARAETGAGDATAKPPAANDGPGAPPGPNPAADAALRRVLLAGGMFARVTLEAGPANPVPAVPKDAVVTRNGVDYIAMVAPGQQEGSLMAIPLPVTTGLDVGDWIAVTSGNLAPGMQIVTKGNESILFPSPIQIVAPLPAPTETALSSSTAPAVSPSKAGS